MLHEILFGTNGIEYFIIFFIKGLSIFPIYFGSFKIASITIAVKALAMVFAHKRPSAPALSDNINTILSMIVDIPNIKFDTEYSLILPRPLDNALLSPISIFDITNVIIAVIYIGV